MQRIVLSATDSPPKQGTNAEKKPTENMAPGALVNDDAGRTPESPFAGSRLPASEIKIVAFETFGKQGFPQTGSSS